MRLAAVEQIPIPQTKHRGIIANGQFNLPFGDTTCFFTFAGQKTGAGIGTGGLCFVQNL